MDREESNISTPTTIGQIFISILKRRVLNEFRSKIFCCVSDASLVSTFPLRESTKSSPRTSTEPPSHPDLSRFTNVSVRFMPIIDDRIVIQ